MSEEEGLKVGVEPTTEIPAVEEKPVEPEVQEEVKTEEPVDEIGVPVKNRLAEANRKLAKAEKLLSQAQDAPVKEDAQVEQDEALRIVESIAEQKVAKRLEPLIAKQFLMEHPDAADMVDDINQIRALYPEISGVDKLDVAYKIARAEKQDELVRKEAEIRAKEIQEKQLKSAQAAVEGTGKSNAPAMTIADRIANATSLDELKQLESLLK